MMVQKTIINKIPLVESLYTIQGEGAFQGSAAYFIRLGGCDVKCLWCDTKESWNMKNYSFASVEQIAQKAKISGSTIAVITGGEHTMHNLLELTNCLHQKGLQTHIETSGVYPLTGQWDWVCFSPKQFKIPLPSIYLKAHELKIIICNKNDFQWAEEQALKVDKSCLLYLQPEWSNKDKIIPFLYTYIKKNIQWKISLQIHKYLHIP